MTVIPDEIPRIWVCTAPATAVLQTSELFTTTLGEFAVGGVLFVTTVLLTVFVSAFALVTVVTTNIKVKIIKLARSLYASGMKVASVSILCQDPRVWDSMTMAGTPCPYMGSIGQDAETGWKENMDMIPEGSVIYAKWNDEINQIKVKEGVESDGAKLAKFIIAAMVMHSGIVTFFP